MEKFLVLCQRIAKQSKYKVFFKYHTEVIEKIKKLPKDQREWDGTEKCWILRTKALYELLKSYRGSDKIHFDFGGAEGKQAFIDQIKKINADNAEKEKIAKELSAKKDIWVKLKEEYEKNYVKYSEKVHANLKADVKLYPHQIVAAMFLNETRSALLALDMGSGKTISSISYVEMNGFKKVLVITPNSLKFNFYNEVRKFTDSKAHIINWKHNQFSVEDSKYIIVNYEFFNGSDKKKLDSKIQALKIGKLDCVIADECHRLKSTTSNTYKNYKRLFVPKSFRDGKVSKVFLSGTPAPNKSYELYSVLNQISPIDFATKQHFFEYYCGMTYDVNGGFGWTTDVAKQKLEELFHKIAPYTYRKKKEDILDLPPKIYQKIVLELSLKDQKMYEEIEEGVANEIWENPTSNRLTLMLRLRQFTSALKMNAVKELVDALLEENKKVVIIDVFKPVLNEIHTHYSKISCLHTGDKSVEERSEMVNKFQDENSDLMIFLATSQTANYGLTLTASSNMIILTQPYSLGEYKQVTDRIHRIGAKSTVNIYPIIFKDTIDEYVFESLEAKQKEISKVIDNEDYNGNINESSFNDIITIINKKHKRKIHE